MRLLTTMYKYVIEPLTKFIAVIQSDHAYIHKGIAFSIAKDLGSISSVTRIGITTPANTIAYIHFRPSSTGIETSADNVVYKMYEDVDFTGGVAYVPFNRNRNSSNISGVVVKTGVTATPGTALYLDNKTIGTEGNRNSRSGGSSGGSDEIILLPSTSYIFEFDPDGATVVSFNVFWYEEDEGGEE